MTQLELDHLKYIRSQAYRRDLHARLRRLIADEPHAMSRMTVVHDTAKGCCREEPWPTTYRKMLDSLVADGERVIGVVL